MSPRKKTMYHPHVGRILDNSEESSMHSTRAKGKAKSGFAAVDIERDARDNKRPDKSMLSAGAEIEALFGNGGSGSSSKVKPPQRPDLPLYSPRAGGAREELLPNRQPPERQSKRNTSKPSNASPFAVGMNTRVKGPQSAKAGGPSSLQPVPAGKFYDPSDTAPESRPRKATKIFPPKTLAIPSDRAGNGPMSFQPEIVPDSEDERKRQQASARRGETSKHFPPVHPGRPGQSHSTNYTQGHTSARPHFVEDDSTDESSVRSMRQSNAYTNDTQFRIKGKAREMDVDQGLPRSEQAESSSLSPAKSSPAKAARPGPSSRKLESNARAEKRKQSPNRGDADFSPMNHAGPSKRAKKAAEKAEKALKGNAELIEIHDSDDDTPSSTAPRPPNESVFSERRSSRRKAEARHPKAPQWDECGDDDDPISDYPPELLPPQSNMTAPRKSKQRAESARGVIELETEQDDAMDIDRPESPEVENIDPPSPLERRTMRKRTIERFAQRNGLDSQQREQDGNPDGVDERTRRGRRQMQGKDGKVPPRPTPKTNGNARGNTDDDYAFTPTKLRLNNAEVSSRQAYTCQINKDGLWLVRLTDPGERPESCRISWSQIEDCRLEKTDSTNRTSDQTRVFMMLINGEANELEKLATLMKYRHDFQYQCLLEWSISDAKGDDAYERFKGALSRHWPQESGNVVHVEIFLPGALEQVRQIALQCAKSARPIPSSKPKPKESLKLPSTKTLSRRVTNFKDTIVGAVGRALTGKRKEEDRDINAFEPTPDVAQDMPRPRANPPPSAAELGDILCIWPPTGRGEVNITKGDYHRLGDGEYLNDTLIEFGLKYIAANLDMWKAESPVKEGVKREVKEEVKEEVEEKVKVEVDEDQTDEAGVIRALQDVEMQDIKPVIGQIDLPDMKPIIDSEASKAEQEFWACSPRDVHIFNSFFYKKLSAKEKKFVITEPRTLPPWAAYESVRKWTAKIDIFEKKYIVVPINENYHWYLAVIRSPSVVLEMSPVAPKKAIRVPKLRSSSGGSKTREPTEERGRSQREGTVDPDDDQQSTAPPPDDMAHPSSVPVTGPTRLSPPPIDAKAFQNRLQSKQKPGREDTPTSAANSGDDSNEAKKVLTVNDGFIMTFDSLGNGSHKGVARILNQWLAYEAQSRHKHFIEPGPLYPLSYRRAPVPSQPNFWDCGIYVLHFTEILLRYPKECVEFILGQQIGSEFKDPSQKRGELGKQVWREDAAAKGREEWKGRIDKLRAELESAKGEEVGAKVAHNLGGRVGELAQSSLPGLADRPLDPSGSVVMLAQEPRFSPVPSDVDELEEDTTDIPPRHGQVPQATPVCAGGSASDGGVPPNVDDIMMDIDDPEPMDIDLEGQQSISHAHPPDMVKLSHRAPTRTGGADTASEDDETGSHGTIPLATGLRSRTSAMDSAPSPPTFPHQNHLHGALAVPTTAVLDQLNPRLVPTSYDSSGDDEIQRRMPESSVSGRRRIDADGDVQMTSPRAVEVHDITESDSDNDMGLDPGL